MSDFLSEQSFVFGHKNSVPDFVVSCEPFSLKCFVVTCWERADLLALVCGDKM